jgi:hypothetical protein
MSRYQLARRSFLHAIGASTGLYALLRTMERRAEGAATSPKRLVVIHRPVGTVYPVWHCPGSGTNFTLSDLVSPFAAVKNNMIVLQSANPVGSDGGIVIAPGDTGAHERGMVALMTSVMPNAVRAVPDAAGDPYANGPSFDQIFLKRGAALQGTPIPSLQLSCDDRVDTLQVSVRRMSYQYDEGTEDAKGVLCHPPLMPYLVPLDAYTRVFGTQMPGGMTTSNVAALQQARAIKKSVLDHNLRELARLRTLAPASEKSHLDAHEAAIRDLEMQLDAAPPDAVACGLAMPPQKTDPKNNLTNPNGTPNDMLNASNGADNDLHALIGKLHFAVLLAALKCDLTRVVTFQWSPGTNHVSFGKFWPSDATKVLEHHPVSHTLGDPDIFQTDPTKRIDQAGYLINVDRFYSQNTAAFIIALANTVDVYGANLLDQTIVPYVSEVARATHAFNPMPILLFGGAGTGFKGGQVMSFPESAKRSTTDMWLSIAAALGMTQDSLKTEKFLANAGRITSPPPAPIAGLFA